MYATTKLRNLFSIALAIFCLHSTIIKAQCPIAFANANQGVINLVLGTNCSATFDATTRLTGQGNCSLLYFKDVNKTIPYNGDPTFSGSNLGQTIEVFVVAEDGNPATPLLAPLKFTIKIVDTNKPTANCPLNQAFIAEGNACNKLITNDLVATGVDNCGGSVTLAWAATGATSSTGNGSLIGKNFNVGRSFVTYNATDASGNTGTCSFTIDVSETVAPTLTFCPADATFDAVQNACERIVLLGITPSYTDNCTPANNITLAYQFSGATDKTGVGSAANSIFKVGTTLVTYTASDAFANKNTGCAFNITIRDIEKPKVTCPADLSLNTTIDSCFTYISATNLTPLRLDNCGQNNLTTSFALSGAVETSILPLQNIVNQRFAKGVTNVTYTVTDADGNTATCVQRITISDKTAPKINCKSSHITTVTPNAECQKLVALEQPSSTDNCTSQQNISLFYSLKGAVMASGNGLIPPNQLFVPGLTTVTYKATDESGNASECSYNVTVFEVPLVKPTLKLPTDVTVAANAASCSATINTGLQPMSASDNCTAIDLLLLQVSMSGATLQKDSFVSINKGANGFTFNVGTTQIRYILTDASGNRDTAFMNVLVLDKQRPVLNCTPNLTFSTANGCARKVLGLKPSANDNCSPNLLEFSYTLSGATPNPTVATSIDDVAFQVGVTTVFFKVTDGGKNIDTCKFDVTITEQIVPTINCPADFTVNTNSSDCTALLENTNAPQLADNCTAVQDLSLDFTTSGATSLVGKNLINNLKFNYGKTIVTYKVTDFSNNSAQCSFSVSVKDATLPKIICPNNITVNAYDTTCYAFVKSPSVTFSDNCSATLTYAITGATMASGKDIFSNEKLNIGKNIVTYRATDNDGNTAQCAFDILIKDITLPKITCPASLTLSSSSASCDANVPAQNPIMTDNCTDWYSYFSVSGVTELGDTEGILTAKNFNVGKSIVKFTIVDVQQNKATCSFEVTVLDQTKPTAKCRANMTIALDNTGNAFVPAMTLDNNSTDNCTALNDMIYTSTKERFNCSNIGANSVILTVKDASGNSSTCTTNVNIVNSFANLNLKAQATATTESYWGATNGSVEATVTGGLGSYDFLWNNSATTAQQGDLTAGIYTVTITDKVSGCNATATTKLEAGPKLKLLVGNLIGAPNSTVLVPVRVQNFNKIKHLQFSLSLSNTAAGMLESLQDFGINATDSIQYSVKNGIVSFQKMFPNSPGLSLPNGTALFYIKVKLADKIGTFSPVIFQSVPLDLGVRQYLPTGLINVPISIQNGSVGVSNGAVSATIKGNVKREDGVLLKDVNISLSGTYEDTTSTKTAGEFQFELPLGARSILKATREGDAREGLTAIDAMLLQRHILGYIDMKSEYKKLSADVNLSGTLSALDVLEIKRVILGYQEKFKIPTWRFVPADYVFPTLDQNQVLATPDSLFLPYLLENQSDKNFIGIKAADLNLSAMANARNEKTLVLQVENKAYAEGETFDVMLRNVENLELSALQLALHFDTDKLEFVTTESTDLQHFNENDININNVTNGDIRMMWINAKNQAIAKNSNILMLKLRAKTNILALNNILYLEEKAMPAIAYEMEKQQSVVIQYVTPKNDKNEIKIYPNPADAVCMIDVPKASAATLFDVKGRVVAHYDLLGNITTSIPTQDLPSGVYLLQIRSDNEILTKKITVLH